tara:strand:- start:5390 stop:6223 length:834 start_codon:yes stop_codon:yes gene_type:complete
VLGDGWHGSKIQEETQRLTKVKLHSTRRGSGPPVILLHGLFGSGNNLGALARSLESRYSVHSVDLPNHGRSEWLNDMALGDLSAALGHWMHHHQLQQAAVVGHSLGGKVAMQLALQSPSSVATAVVADIAPVAYAAHHDAVFAALDAVAAARCTSRQQAEEIMAASLDDAGTIAFLLMSLQRCSDGAYGWRFNLEGLKLSYAAVRDAPAAHGPYTGPVLFIKGSESDYILAQHRQAIQSLFPAAKLKVMQGCGHWLHAQRPQLFNALVGRFLDEHYS